MGEEDGVVLSRRTVVRPEPVPAPTRRHPEDEAVRVLLGLSVAIVAKWARVPKRVIDRFELDGEAGEHSELLRDVYAKLRELESVCGIPTDR